MSQTNKGYRNGFIISFTFHAAMAYALFYGVEEKVDMKEIEEKFVTISLSSFEPPKQVEEKTTKEEQIPKEQVKKNIIKPQENMAQSVTKTKQIVEIKKAIESPKLAETKDIVVEESMPMSETSADLKSLINVEEVAIKGQKEELQKEEIQDTFAQTNFHSIRDKVLAHLKYPPIAKKMKQMGMVEVLLLIDTNGKLIEVTLHKSSGYALLDKSALSAAAKLAAQTLPIPQKNSRVMLPIYFALN